MADKEGIVMRYQQRGRISIRRVNGNGNGEPGRRLAEQETFDHIRSGGIVRNLVRERLGHVRQGFTGRDLVEDHPVAVGSPFATADEHALFQLSTHVVEQGFNADLRVRPAKREEINVPFPHRAGQGDQRTVGRHMDLHLVVLTKAKIGIERLIAVVGARRRRKDIDDQFAVVAAERSGQRDIVGIEQRSIQEVILKVFRHPCRDLVAAGRIQRHDPRRERAERVLLGLRVVADDFPGLPLSCPIDDCEDLVDEINRILVLGMALERDDQFVGNARINERVMPLAKTNPSDDRRNAHFVGARGINRILQERIIE